MKQLLKQKRGNEKATKRAEERGTLLLTVSYIFKSAFAVQVRFCNNVESFRVFCEKGRDSNNYWLLTFGGKGSYSACKSSKL